MCGPREEGNLGFGFWNFEFRLSPWIYRFDLDVTENQEACAL